MNKQDLKAIADIRTVLQYYGIEVYRNKIHCISHNDNNPSMYVYKRNVHCFACGADFDAIGFIMYMEKCDYHTAVERLGTIFGIGVEKTSSETVRRFKAERERQKRIVEARNSKWRHLTKRLHSLEKEYAAIVPTDPDKRADWLMNDTDKLDHVFGIVAEIQNINRKLDFLWEEIINA